VAEPMGDVYPELREQRPRVAELVRLEEERFAETLDAGETRIKEYLGIHGEGAGRPADGALLFKLYDTYGFPRDLAEDMLRDRGGRATAERRAASTAASGRQRQ